MDVEAEIAELKRRVGDLEGAVNVLSGRFGDVLPQLAGVKRDSAAGFDRMGVTLDRVLSRLDVMNTQVWSLRDDLPALLSAAIGGNGQRDGEGG